MVWKILEFFPYNEVCILETKKVATNIPKKLLMDAVRMTGLNQTQAIIAGLHELIAKKRRDDLLSLKGKVHLSLDLEKSRERKKVS